MTESPILFTLLDINRFEPDVPGKLSVKKELTSDSSILLESFSYSRCGIFIKGLNLPYEYFLVNNIFRLGFIVDALGVPFNMTSTRKLKQRQLTVLWTDSLEVIDCVYKAQIEPFIIEDSKKDAMVRFNRLLEMLKWIRIQKSYLLKNSRCKEITPLFSEYVMNVGIPLSTLQSGFLDHAKKSLNKDPQ